MNIFPLPSWIYGLIRDEFSPPSLWLAYRSSQSWHYYLSLMDSAWYLTPFPFSLIHSKSRKALFPCSGQPSLWLCVCSVSLLLLTQVVLKEQKSIWRKIPKADGKCWWWADGELWWCSISFPQIICSKSTTSNNAYKAFLSNATLLQSVKHNQSFFLFVFFQTSYKRCSKIRLTIFKV